MGFDYYIFSLINQYAGQNAYLDKTFVFFAEYLILVFVLFFLIEFRNVKAVFNAIASVFAAGALIKVISLFYSRPRPFVSHNVNLLVNHLGTASFPSGHASISFALATSVFLYNRKAGVFAYVIAAIISFSRIFTGVHYPLDVLAGIPIGIIAALVTNFFVKRCAGYFGIE